MRVSKAQAEANRTSLLEAAGRLFREKGIDGVGVADIAKEAGLTHGALYAHFSSKEVLAAAAFCESMNQRLEAMRKQTLTFENYIDSMLSIEHRDNLSNGCPMTASAGEIARQGPELATEFARAFEETVKILAASIQSAIPAARKRRLAISALVAEIGAQPIARAVASVNAALSKEVLDAGRSMVRTMLSSSTDGAHLPRVPRRRVTTSRNRAKV